MSRNSKDEAHEIAVALTRAVNNMTFDHEEFVETVLREHRTLQQNVFEAFLHLCKAWAALPENRYDARNEYTVQRSREIMELLAGCARTPFI